MPAPPRHSPAAERNKGPILAALRDVLGDAGAALEVASGTGQHASHFASELPGWSWQPSDQAATAGELAALAADIDFHSREANGGKAPANLLAPIALDVLAPDWPGLGRFDAIFSANMLHIAPWACCAGLMRLATRHLKGGGLLVVYGPFFDDDAPAPGNVAFDADLRARNPAWGIRRLADVAVEARQAGLSLQQRFAMPANNLLLVFALTVSKG